MFKTFFKPNVGLYDRLFRLIMGCVLVYFRRRNHSYPIEFVIIGVGIIISALTGYSALYKVFGLNTIENKEKAKPSNWKDAILAETQTRRRMSFRRIRLPAPLLQNRPVAQPRVFVKPDFSVDELQDMISEIEKNNLDEMLMLRIYENFFKCSIDIVYGHVFTYQCTFANNTQVIDYSTLKTDLLKALQSSLEVA